MRTLLIVAALTVACGGSRHDASKETRAFNLVVPDRAVVHAGETLMITVLAIGSTGPVNYVVQGLPPYATAEGNTIRAAPSRSDLAGDSSVIVTATDGSDVVSASFVLSLANAAPAWKSPATLEFHDDWVLSWTSPVSLDAADAPLVFPARARITAAATDADGDAVELLVELRPKSEPMTGNPTMRIGNAPLRTELPALMLGTHYALDVWLQDSHGSQSSHFRRSDVTRGNLPPVFLHESELVIEGVEGLTLLFNHGGPYVLTGQASIQTYTADPDGDAVNLNVELRPVGEPFTGTPTQTAALGMKSWPGTETCWAQDKVPLAGMTIGMHYQMSWWLTDAYGAERFRFHVDDVMRSR